MKLQQAISLGLMAAGVAASLKPLQRRRAWDEANRTVALALDYDDVVEATVRAGLPLDDLLHRLWHAGATHLTIPEDSLGRLREQGRIAVVIPRQRLVDRAPVGRWNYLAAHEAGQLARLQRELAARQPHLQAQLMEDEGRSLLALAGDLKALQYVGLGFDAKLAAIAQEAGLQPLPRPASYAWPTAETIDRSLAQAAQLGIKPGSAAGPAIVAFQGVGAPGHVGELILGHEMLMHETIAALRRHGLALAYFVESRHQRGDWFVAKSLAPQVVLAHQFTQSQLIAEDMHSAAHRWGLLAREQGIRLALLQLFKVVHATTPLDCIDYVAAVADVLVNREGFQLSGRPNFQPTPVHHGHDHGQHGHHHHHHDHSHGQEDQQADLGFGISNLESGISDPASDISESEVPDPNSQPPPPLPRDDNALPWLALVPAAAGALVLDQWLDLPGSLSIPLALAGLLAPAAVQRLDRPANELEVAFRPSYGPKVVALGTAALVPLAAGIIGRRGGPLGLVQALAIEGAGAMALAATVAEHDYALRIEEVRTEGLDWILPLAGAVSIASLSDQAPRSWRSALALVLAGSGLAMTRSGLLPADPLADLDREHTAEHTHHLSRAQATLGDARMAISPRPLRKWTWPWLFAQTAATLAQGRVADLASVAAALGGIAFLAGFRQAARPLDLALADRLSGWPMRATR